MNELRTLLVCIGRLENPYIREFVEYYKNAVGFTNICLCDNNRGDEENFHDAIGDYIDDGYVIIEDYRGILIPCQNWAYSVCFYKYRDSYDWMAFFDIDEFLCLNGVKINELLMDEKYNDFDCILTNWLCVGDCEQLYYQSEPVTKRFNKPLPIETSTIIKGAPDNSHVKPIVRCTAKNFSFKFTIHVPTLSGNYCLLNGAKCKALPLQPIDYSSGFILHYTTKSTEEFANKVNRGFCDTNTRKKENIILNYFERNTVTKEKIDIFIERTGIDVSYLLNQ